MFPMWKIYRSSIVLFKNSFKDPRFCSLGFFIGPREEGFGEDLDDVRGTVR